MAPNPIFAVQKLKWRVGQGVKTPPFHGGITGSNPVRATKIKCPDYIRVFLFRMDQKKGSHKKDDELPQSCNPILNSFFQLNHRRSSLIFQVYLCQSYFSSGMKNKPVKRSPYIVKLSRDHHAGLLFCWKIRQAKKYLIAHERVKPYVAYFTEAHLAPHFKEEEEILFAPKPGDALVQRAMQEHKNIKRLSAEVATASGVNSDALLDAIANAVDNHIRFEERTLFPHLEQVLTEEQLKEISTQLDHEPEQDAYPDEFWLKPKS